MILYFWRRSQYATYAEAKKLGGLRQIDGLLDAISTTCGMMDSNESLGYVLLDDNGNLLDAM